MSPTVKALAAIVILVVVAHLGVALAPHPLLLL